MLPPHWHWHWLLFTLSFTRYLVGPLSAAIVSRLYTYVDTYVILSHYPDIGNFSQRRHLFMTIDKHDTDNILGRNGSSLGKQILCFSQLILVMSQYLCPSPELPCFRVT